MHPWDDVGAVNERYFQRKSHRRLVAESPHLSHASLRALCDRLSADVFRRVAAGDKIPAVLDMGAGDGDLTLRFLRWGAQVTAADATEALLGRLQETASGLAGALTIAPGDIFATLDALRNESRQFEIVCASSFLHHIPDFLRMCREVLPLLAPRGIFFSFQDPLRYDTQPGITFGVDRMAYFWWRLFQGNCWRGIKTRVRRLRGIYRDDLAEDAAEYHVVRNGVDQVALERLWSQAGFDCTIHCYWSTQSALGQKIGELLRLANTFALVAQRRPLP
jgi:SAM-dependent methyltransferase